MMKTIKRRKMKKTEMKGETNKWKKKKILKRNGYSKKSR